VVVRVVVEAVVKAEVVGGGEASWYTRNKDAEVYRRLTAKPSR